MADESSGFSFTELTALVEANHASLRDREGERHKAEVVLQGLDTQISRLHGERSWAIRQFIDGVAAADPLYRASFEIAWQDEPVEVGDTEAKNLQALKKLQQIDMIGRTVVGLSEYFARQESEQPLLTISERTRNLGDDRNPDNITTIDAALLIVEAWEVAYIESQDTYSIARGSATTAHRIFLPVISGKTVCSVINGFEDVTWVNDPMVHDAKKEVQDDLTLTQKGYRKIWGEVHIPGVEEMSLGNGDKELYVGAEAVKSCIEAITADGSKRYERRTVEALAKVSSSLL